MKEILLKLKKEFPKEDLEFRVGATNSDRTMGLALAYVQARAIQNRLDEVLGIENWKVTYREIQGGFICTLSLRIGGEWIEKEDGAQSTEFESIKGGISSAFKRVASSGFGIGRYLYNAKNNWFPIKKSGNTYIFSSLPVLELNNKNTLEKEKEDIKEKVKQINVSNVIITFGKYKGFSLKEIFKNDKSYIKYLIEKSKDIEIVNACKKLLAS